VRSVLGRLGELPLGGTAVGTGVNTHPEFARKTIERLAAETGLDVREASDHFEAQGARDAFVETSGALKTVAVSAHKIANDIRWMSSGPSAGLSELRVPALQPGSSIMPGKVNPVYSEMVCQVSVQVVGNDAAIALGGLSGNFELNVMVPVMGWNLLESITILASSLRLFAEGCVDGLEADETRCLMGAESSLSIVTALVPEVGYDRAAEIAKEAAATGKSVREAAIGRGVDPEIVDRALDLRSMTEPGV
jgi:fumarate hydratase class II